MKKIKFGLYRHYKGKIYKVLNVGFDSENLEKVVIYQGQYNSLKFGNKPVFVRALKMFMEDININGKATPRFQCLE